MGKTWLSFTTACTRASVIRGSVFLFSSVRNKVCITSARTGSSGLNTQFNTTSGVGRR